MAHIWYLKGRPSYISLLLDIKQKEAEKLVYGEYWIFRNFTLEFEKRIRHLRAEFDQENYRFHKRGYSKPEYTNPFEKDPNTGQYYPPSVRLRNRIFQRIYKEYPFDFWVHSPIYHKQRNPPGGSGLRIVKSSRLDSTSKKQNPLAYARKAYSWTKSAFFLSKPFYRTPLVRDSLIGYYDKEKEYNREKAKTTEDQIIRYLFPDRRKVSIQPRWKYKKALNNSMIYHQNFRSHCLIIGGDAFRHLFSKIDVSRMYQLLFFKMTFGRLRMRAIENKLKRKSGLAFKDLNKETLLFYLKQSEVDEYQLRKKFYSTLGRKLKLFKIFWRTGTRPEWMFISYLPIIPPDLRPILKLNSNQLAVSDLNRLYQYVLLRNKNLKGMRFSVYKRALNLDFSIKNGIQVSKIDYECDFQTYQFSLKLLSFHTNQVQRALDALFENNKGGSQAICGLNDRPLKSLSEILKGKTGRFRQNLLGKRVDYSGRSVIVVGPTLKLYQCGLPKEIALELFQPLLIRKMILLNLSKTIIGAKKLIHQDHPIIWHLLNNVMTNYPILLNRAPTLHRLGFQGFLPKLVRGKAILLHPLVCPAFNADFDGDQMGVHLPISIEAKSEAWSLMLATQNILSPATGEPILTPSQDMVLGCYYSTTINLKTKFTQSTNYFTSIDDAYKTYLHKNLHPHKFVWLRWNGVFESNQSKKKIKEIRLKIYQKKLNESIYIAPNAHQTFQPKAFAKGPMLLTGSLVSQYLRTTIGRIIINKLFQDDIINFKRKYTNYFTKTRNTVLDIQTQKAPNKHSNLIPSYFGYLSSITLDQISNITPMDKLS
uniref:RNA polymerase beta' subunit n=1 Tax=Tetraselmis suecica TaxID=270643 RepID=UPI0021D52A58|nr:RNA polymerase beta' subunit [Tetraselmis suecica]UXF58525.1 RNA polymerase beta' subunit [Tetraselmis suecica]